MFYAGTIQTASGATLGRSNQQTGISGSPVPFRIPRDCAVYLSPDMTGMRWALGASAGFACGVTNSAPLGAPDSLSTPYGMIGENPTISVIGPIGGTVKVFVGPR